MGKSAPSGTGLIAFSLMTYRLLLAFYPAGFRQEYGPHMVQVFRDCCFRSYRQSGLQGMLALWVLTLFDWLKTVIEQQLHRDTDMTRAKRIRLSGWGLMVGPLALFVGLGDPGQYRSLLNGLFGVPDDSQQVNAYRFVSETVPSLLIILGLLLILFGFWGMQSQYQSKAGKSGRFCLRFLVLNAGIAAAGGALSLSGNEIWWLIFLFGFFATYLFLGVFGITALKDKPLPRWNLLPLITGLWFPSLLVIGILTGWDAHPYFMILPMIFSLAGSALIGFILQSDAGATAIM